MPQVRFAPAALRDLERLRDFLRPKSSDVATRAAIAIKKAVQALGQHPNIGRPVETLEAEYRELLIEFGDSGHLALYRYDDGDFPIVLAIQRQKELGY